MSKGWHKDNGPYTRIANKIIEAAIILPLSGRDWRVLMAVIRATYGYGRKDRPLALSYIAKMTGISRANVSRGLARLVKVGVLLKRQQKGVAELATVVLPEQQQAKSVQVYGVNKSITKIQKAQGVASLATIKEIINFFKESAEKGGFAAAFSAWLKEIEETMPLDENDKFLIQGIRAVGKIYVPGCLAALDKSQKIQLVKIEARVNAFNGKLAPETTDPVFAEAVNDLYRFWKSAIEKFNKVTGR